MIFKKFLSVAVAGILPAFAACSATDSQNAGIDRSYTLTKFNDVPVPTVIAEGPFGSSTLTEGQLKIERNGSYSLSYTLVINANGAITADVRSESGKYSIKNNEIDFLPGFTHSSLSALDNSFVLLRGEINIRPCACGYQSATYMETD